MQTFHRAKSMKEQRVGGVDNKDTKFWIAENGMIEFQIFERAIQ